VVGKTHAEALAKKARLDSLVHPDSGLGSLSILLGHDIAGYPLDGPLPDIAESNATKSQREKIIQRARSENLTINQLAQWIGGSFGTLEIVGTVTQVVDEMAEWFTSGACDGFNLMFPFLPEGLNDFVDGVVPELQRRGLFRTHYEGKTLRENLGLPRPSNRFFSVSNA